MHLACSSSPCGRYIWLKEINLSAVLRVTREELFRSWKLQTVVSSLCSWHQLDPQVHSQNELEFWSFNTREHNSASCLQCGYRRWISGGFRIGVPEGGPDLEQLTLPDSKLVKGEFKSIWREGGPASTSKIEQTCRTAHFGRQTLFSGVGPRPLSPGYARD